MRIWSSNLPSTSGRAGQYLRWYFFRFTALIRRTSSTDRISGRVCCRSTVSITSVSRWSRSYVFGGVSSVWERHLLERVVGPGATTSIICLKRRKSKLAPLKLERHTMALVLSTQASCSIAPRIWPCSTTTSCRRPSIEVCRFAMPVLRASWLASMVSQRWPNSARNAWNHGGVLAVEWVNY